MNSLGAMRAEMIEADFDEGTLKFRPVGEYYAAAGYYYLVPADVFEDMREKASGNRRIEEH